MKEEIPPPRALVPFADGFEDVEAVAIVDVLRRGGVEVVTASLGDKPFAKSAHGIVMSTDAVLADVLENEYNAIILPGGAEGTKNLKESDALLERLRQQKGIGGLVCAICAAPTVLDAAGVIDDEAVTCYPSCRKDMGRSIARAPVVADGQVITGTGPGTALLFAHAVLAHLKGDRVAHGVANGMLVDF